MTEVEPDRPTNPFWVAFRWILFLPGAVLASLIAYGITKVTILSGESYSGWLPPSWRGWLAAWDSLIAESMGHLVMGVALMLVAYRFAPSRKLVSTLAAFGSVMLLYGLFLPITVQKYGATVFLHLGCLAVGALCTAADLWKEERNASQH